MVLGNLTLSLKIPSSSWVGALVPELKRYCYAYFLRRNRDPTPRLHYPFLTAPPLSLHLLPSLISHCSNLPSGTQERSGKQESTPYKHRMGDPKASVCWSPTWFCSFSALGSGTGMEMPLSVIQSCVISGSG